MSMGIVDEEELEAELERLNNKSVKNGQVVDLPKRGRGRDNVAVPEVLQKIIGETAIENGRSEAVELAERFGISKSSVSAYTNGSSSTASYSEPKPAIQSHLSKVRNRISKKASRKLFNALEHITEDKLAASSASELASVAKAMSGIVETMEPEMDKEKDTRSQFIVYAPQVITNENRFQVIHVDD